MGTSVIFQIFVVNSRCLGFRIKEVHIRPGTWVNCLFLENIREQTLSSRSFSWSSLFSNLNLSVIFPLITGMTRVVMGYTYDLKSCLTWVIHRNFFSRFLHAKHYWFIRQGLCQENITVQLRDQSLFIARGWGGGWRGGLGARQGDIVIVRSHGLLCHFYADDAQL